jgi:hypothetical protein
MTRTMSSIRKSIPKIAPAGVIIAIPTVGVSVPVPATPGFSGASNAASSTDVPELPAPQPLPQPAQAPVYDWWAYGQSDGGAGGGGG